MDKAGIVQTVFNEYLRIFEIFWQISEIWQFIECFWQILSIFRNFWNSVTIFENCRELFVTIFNTIRKKVFEFCFLYTFKHTSLQPFLHGEHWFWRHLSAFSWQIQHQHYGNCTIEWLFSCLAISTAGCSNFLIIMTEVKSLSKQKIIFLCGHKY